MSACRFVAIDRGKGHIHRYTPSCSCEGWFGRHRRTIAEAKRTWVQGHRDAPKSTYRVPAPLTPQADLPEILRTQREDVP